MSTRIVILGGGYAGVRAAKDLEKKYRRDSSVEITLIDRNPYHTLMTELHEIAGSRTEPEAVQVTFKKIFGGRRVNVVIDDIRDIDFANRELHSEGSVYQYDYLIIGSGGAPEFFDIPGVQENSFTLWSLEDALRIRTHVEERFRDAAKEPDPEQRRKLLTFAIAGAGFTGVEIAGELLERRDVLCPKYHIDPREVRVVIIELMDAILPIFPEKPRHAAAKRLRRMGCETMLNTKITGAEEGRVLLGDAHLDAATFIWTAGIHGGALTSRIPLTQGRSARGECSVASPEGIHGMAGCAFEDDERYVVGKRGRILVNEFMQSVDYEDVYLVGDVIWFVEKEHVLPQIVETALQTGETAAHNIVARIDEKEQKAFESNYHGHMVSIGSRYGVAHVMGMSMKGFSAMAVKHLINVHYLFELSGVNAVWEYLKEEFFDVKDKRSIVHGHLSGKVSAFWTLPLRLWLGGMWLYEGVKKVAEGWLNPGDGGLGNVWTGAIHLPGVSFAAEGADAASAASEAWGEEAAETTSQAADAASSAAADATAAASEWVEEGANQAADAASSAADAVANVAADAASAATAAVEGAVEGAAQAASQYGDPIIPALGIYNWFAENVLSASPLLAFLAQSSVVLAEIGIGLALIGGFLVFPAAAISIALCLMFMISGWGTVELFWYISAAIVMLGGAGRAFGIDHYSTPLLRKWWSGTDVAQRTYLYTGEPRD